MDTVSAVGQQFLPHGMCYLWNPAMLLLQIASDGAIALAYFSIPIVLLSVIAKRRDVPFGAAIVMCSSFIIACGLTHLMAIWTIWHPAFWLDGAIKATTAVISLATAVMLVPLLPKALTLRTPAELERLNARLEADLLTRESALSESERRYRSLAEALPQIVWTANADGGVDYYNARWFAYTGLTFEQTQGWGWRPVLHPDDLPTCIATWSYAIEHGTPFEIESRFRRAADGVYRWHLGRALPILDDGGTIIKWFGTCTDIDDQKRASESTGRLAEQLRLNAVLEADVDARARAEAALRASDERFRQVEEHAPIGLALVALSGRFIRVNPALCAITGYRNDELLSTTFQQLTHPEDLDADLHFVAQTLEGVIADYEMEKRYFHKDGHVVWVQLSASLVRDDAHRPSYFIAQIQDISARKSAEAELRQAQASALAATEAKSRFLATMSHEIRTPMNGIIGMTELLALSQLSEEQMEYVTVVRDSGRSLLRVLNDILDYSKIEAGKLEIETLEFDLVRQLTSVVALLRAQYNAKDVALTTYVDSDLPLTLVGDPGRIRQILINFVGNALKFTAAGGNVRIEVTRDTAKGTAPDLRFAVIDSGIGIAPDVRDRLFMPFSQLDSSTTRRYGGTGLGLSISRQLVDLMGGRIGVESTLGVGSSFWFTLPCLAGGHRTTVLDAPVRSTGERRRSVRARSEKILLAEDNKINALLAIKQFAQLGFEVTVVPTGCAAVAAVQNAHFDVVFMDCHMPEMDGLQATREIRSSAADANRRVPIVALTADAQADDRRACLAAGMDDYISKPVTLTVLRAALTRWLPFAIDSGEPATQAGR